MALYHILQTLSTGGRKQKILKSLIFSIKNKNLSK
jgi:hypothetical protein